MIPGVVPRVGAAWCGVGPFDAADSSGTTPRAPSATHESRIAQEGWAPRQLHDIAEEKRRDDQRVCRRAMSQGGGLRDESWHCAEALRL
jgi:hypothetical protein